MFSVFLILYHNAKKKPAIYWLICFAYLSWFFSAGLVNKTIAGYLGQLKQKCIFVLKVICCYGTNQLSEMKWWGSVYNSRSVDSVVNFRMTSDQLSWFITQNDFSICICEKYFVSKIKKILKQTRNCSGELFTLWYFWDFLRLRQLMHMHHKLQFHGNSLKQTS